MPWAKVHDMLRKIPETLTFRRILLIMLGTAIGLHNIHQRVDITEGGVLGMLLLLDHWFGIPPSITTPVLDITCYLLAWRFLGSRFILLSIVSTTSMSLFFGLWDLFPPMLPDLSGMPLLARTRLPVHRPDRAGIVADLYPGAAHRLLAGHGVRFLVPHRHRQGRRAGRDAFVAAQAPQRLTAARDAKTPDAAISGSA